MLLYKLVFFKIIRMPWMAHQLNSAVAKWAPAP